ncbi:MAG: SPOR domain-containing protein [Candidatus Omnitrophota bacterium]|nr:SPOR domain-containing protein [Candidatus Omnitrophota bacterium]
MKNLNKAIKFCILTFIFTFLLFTFTSICHALNLDSLKTNLLKGDYKAAIAEGEKLIAKDPHSDELYYLLGLCYLKDGNYLRASDIFEVIIKEFNRSRFKEEALLGLGDTYLLREDFEKARQTYQGIIKRNSDTKLKAQIYYRLSEIGFKKGDAAQGQDYLAKLRGNYPQTPEVKQSQDICPVGKNNFNFYYSVQIGSFSNPVNANNLVQKLLASGYPAYTEDSSTMAGVKAYRVRVGKLKFRQEAEDLNKKLAQEGYPTRICP